LAASSQDASRARVRRGLRRGCALLLCLACAALAMAQDVAPAAEATATAAGGDRAAQEAAARARLAAVRDELRAARAAREAAEAERGLAQAALREQDEAVAAAATALAEADAALADGQAAIAALVAEAAAIEARLAEQRAAIAALLRSAYALGRHQGLRLLLGGDSGEDTSRLLGYHRHIEAARSARARALLGELDALASARTALAAAQADEVRRRDEQAARHAELVAARSQRAAEVAAIETRLADAGARIAAIAKDEAEVLALIRRLTDAIADIPRQLAGGEPFSSLRGRLPWPVDGRVIEAFGSAQPGGRAGSGVLIEAAEGTPVRAVSHGRVAYADWLRGYGMLVILDHGDGWMTLYGHNESLSTEVGMWVDARDTIATAGRSGGGGGSYFELRAGGRAQDPVRWLTRR
jgi:septal ring factor EnvC (AmiA/AmiB activator)